jgi:hypothetical protein
MVHRSDAPGDQNDDNSAERFFRGALLGLAVAMPMWLLLGALARVLVRRVLGG